ncbi:MAG TPA: exodeoxyribonuclease VII large subunit [Acetobacteraceae bacterium]|jgi:exodeoxyribonuclease VII large subunit|nr:exodeoxyribonuclease VII large subunit [Acetobacteraceae bacterium]
MNDLRLDPIGNVPEFTVSEISGAVKRTLEGNFGRVRVRGEITELKRYPSGHIYFSLKDEGAKLSGIVWKSAIPRLGMQPENGVEVVATGRISSYAERSSYQLIVERMEYAGAGALLARIEALRLRLAAEGLFDAARKRILPGLPSVIGVVTSERGAVIQDIRTTITRRFPRPILLWPVPVQGEGAAERIAAAIAGFDALPAGGPIPRPDVLIVARGGGSLEDLMAFNEEIVVRAAAACRIPLISAVGHETDTTLIDFVSDRRAPTPTAAAELAIPPRADLLADLAHTAARLIGALNRLMQERRLGLSRAERGLPDLPALVGTARQRLDDRAERLRLALPNLVRRWAARLTLASSTLASALRHTLAARRDRAIRVLARVSPAPLQARLREARARLDGAAGRLESVSPLAVLQRGYALVTDAVGHPLTTAAAISPGARLRLRFADGEVGATADGGAKPERQGRLEL